jgi:probable phosphoglycerate mutase
MTTAEHQVSHFGLMRHARTRWNQEKRIQGQQDSPLTSEGRRAAVGWGKAIAGFRWDRIIASDLPRCQTTANLVNQSLQVPLSLDHRLREQDWGSWSGRRLKDLQQKEAQEIRRQVSAGWLFCPPEGESRHAVWQRSRSALAEAAGQWAGENILIISHEGVIKALTYRLCQRHFMPDEPLLLKPQHLHWLVFKEDRLHIQALNAVPLT